MLHFLLKILFSRARARVCVCVYVAYVRARAGTVGAGLSSGVVLILGFANLIADGISMGFGDYLSSQAEREYTENERKRETWCVYARMCIRVRVRACV